MSATLPFARPGELEEGPDEPESDHARRGLLVVVALVVVLVLVLATWIVAFSPLLGVKSVIVRGAHTLTQAQIRAAAGIKHGTPLVRLDAAAVARRVEALPDIASATVRPAYPSSVVITVSERVAVGYVAQGTSYLLLDKTGTQYRRTVTRPRGLPLFGLPSGTNAMATGRAVASVAASLSPALLARVASVQAFDPTAITLLLADRRVVRWGSAERSADKARILPILLTQPGSQFDVTDPDQVVTH